MSLADHYGSTASFAISLSDHCRHRGGRTQADGARTWQAARWGVSMPTATSSGFHTLATPLLGGLTAGMEPAAGTWVAGNGYVPVRNEARNSAARLEQSSGSGTRIVGGRT